MSAREEFLSHLQSRLATPAPENIAHPVKSVDGIPSVRYIASLDDPVLAFQAAASALGAKVERIPDDTALAEFVGRAITEHEVRTVVLSNDPECARVRAGLEGVEIAAFESFRSAERAELGITGAALGIAATGTLVLRADRAGGRSASLVPPVYFALIEASNIVAESGEMFRRMSDRFPEGLPSQLVLVSGPSRSADIELTLTVGVHGPGHVWIAILDS